MSNGRFSCCVCHQKWSLLIFEPLTLENQTGDLSLWTLWDVCCIQRYKWAGQKLLFETDCIQGGQNSETFYFFIWRSPFLLNIFGNMQINLHSGQQPYQQTCLDQRSWVVNSIFVVFFCGQHLELWCVLSYKSDLLDFSARALQK